MKITRALPLLLFAISLGLGIMMGKRLIPSQANPDTHAIATLANNQRTIIVIVVDRLEKNASLAAIWTLIYPSDFHTPTWIPIYPSLATENAAFAEELAASFELTNKLKPGDNFLQLLRKNNLAWSGYVVVDGKAILETMDFFNIATRPQNISEWLALVSIQSQDRTTALRNQVYLLQSICQGAADQSVNFDLLKLYNRIHKHIRSDFNLNLAFTEWDGFFHTEGNLTCQFPLISTAAQP